MNEFVKDDRQDSKGLMFYRCMLCAGVVSVWDIRAGGCPKCGGTRIKPTNLSFFEKIRTIIKQPKVWTWKNATQPPNMIDPKSL